MDEGNEIEEVEVPVKVEPIKKKRVMSEKQLEALARGRAKGKDVIRAKGVLTREVKESTNTFQKIKQEEKVDTIEDIKKINDLNYIRKQTEELNNKINNIHLKFNDIDTKFSGYLTEREERKKIKDSKIVEKTIKANIPKALSDVMYKEKLAKEQSKNPFYGRL